MSFRGVKYGVVSLLLTVGSVSACSSGTEPQVPLTGADREEVSATPIPPGGIAGRAPSVVDNSYKSDWPTYAAIREVSAAEAPVTRATCLQELGFPHTIGERDGAYEYGPFTEEQWISFEMASEQCAQQYPVRDSEELEDPSEEQLIALYAHQRDVWVPCMRELDIDLGELPSQAAFLADQNWIDPDALAAGVNRAMADGTLAHSNAWLEQCPDRPEGWPAS